MDLSTPGIQDSVVKNDKHYSIRRDEIVTDAELFEEAARNSKPHESLEGARAILSLYKGEYLSDFEALWAVAKRLKYAEIYKRALELISSIP